MLRPLLLILALAVPALPRDVMPTGPTYAGKLPAGADSGFAARLDSAHGQYLMSMRDRMLVGFAFERGEFVPRCSLPLPTPITFSGDGSPLSVGRTSAAGDVDGDGLDEIVVAGSRTIRRYELIRGEFALTAEAAVGPDSGTRPTLCFDVCIGDVNHDSTNEVLLSGVESLPSFGQHQVNHPVTLYVCRWTNRDMAELWNDQGKLHLQGPSWIAPITRMLGVYDPTNMGHSKLLMEEGKSDVRASEFDELGWAPDGLHRAGYFVIRDGRMQWNGPDNPGGAADRCDFAPVGGKTVILTQIIGDPWRGEYFTFSGDSAAEHRVLWSDSDFDWWSPSTGIIIDPDGKGPGALRFMYPREGGPKFEFYRL